MILRIKYTEKVDIWTLGCILAELYSGEPLFPGNNEQEQIELIMELCGMPPQDQEPHGTIGVHTYAGTERGTEETARTD